MKKRQNVSWKINHLDPVTNEKVNKWLNEQNNMTQSLAVAVNVMIEVMGYTDVRSYENQHKLHEILSILYSDGPKASKVLNSLAEKKVVRLNSSDFQDEVESSDYEKDLIDGLNLNENPELWSVNDE
ncbi:hypothetical protein [Bacillus pumilus]|uniref:hypothetical protein n=1 Tax=Bacillus pumilus TaxID=1408 RepID=UPI0011A628C8|nr:hypothetical protein [Bacillus pumilus]